MTETVREKLDKAWLFRLTQKIDECVSLLEDCKAGSLSSQNDQLDLSEQTDLLLLEASIARAKRDLKSSDRLIAQASELMGLGSGTHKIPFQLSLQKGLNLYNSCDYTNALDHFITANRGSRTVLEKASALGNILLCLESLGLPGAAVYHEFRGMMSDLGKSIAYEPFSTTLNCYELRTHFRAGVFSSVFARNFNDVEPRQEHYYQLWASEFPFQHGQVNRLSAVREKLYMASPWLHQKAYRLRTLQIRIHPDDLTEFKATEFADRVYLWVWKWMENSDHCPVERIVELLSQIDMKTLTSRLTAEDFQMVRNALHWLSLFEPSSFNSVHKVTQSLQLPYIEDYPIFQFEKLAIDYFSARRDGANVQKIYEAMESHPLWNSLEFLLPSLVREVASHPEKSPELGPTRLLKLKTSLVKIIWHGTSSGEKPGGSELLVDLASWIVRATAEKKRAISEPMCLAFQLLKAKESVSFSEFMHQVFGIYRYESDIHDSKIFNLLARMREFAPDGLVLKTKANRVYGSGSWGSVTFLERPCDMDVELSRRGWKAAIGVQAAGMEKSTPDLQLKPVFALSRLQGVEEITREDLEKLIGRSRSTANRMIAQWLSQGLLKKVGSAKNTKYVLL